MLHASPCDERQTNYRRELCRHNSIRDSFDVNHDRCECSGPSVTSIIFYSRDFGFFVVVLALFWFIMLF